MKYPDSHRSDNHSVEILAVLALLLWGLTAVMQGGARVGADKKQLKMAQEIYASDQQ